MIIAKTKFLFIRSVRSCLVDLVSAERQFTTTLKRLSDNEKSPDTHKFDEKMLEYLVCPLSKKPLRYDKDSQLLICDEMGVAYPIINGIPNLIPQDARKIHEDTNVNKT